MDFATIHRGPCLCGGCLSVTRRPGTLHGRVPHFSGLWAQNPDSQNGGSCNEADYYNKTTTNHLFSGKLDTSILNNTLIQNRTTTAEGKAEVQTPGSGFGAAFFRSLCQEQLASLLAEQQKQQSAQLAQFQKPVLWAQFDMWACPFVGNRCCFCFSRKPKGVGQATCLAPLAH